MVTRMLNDEQLAERWSTTRATISRQRQRKFLPTPHYQGGRAQWPVAVIEFFEKNGFSDDPKAFRKKLAEDAAIVGFFQRELAEAMAYGKENNAPAHVTRFAETVFNILDDGRLPIGYCAGVCRLLDKHLGTIYGADAAKLEAITNRLYDEHRLMLGLDDTP